MSTPTCNFDTQYGRCKVRPVVSCVVGSFEVFLCNEHSQSFIRVVRDYGLDITLTELNRDERALDAALHVWTILINRRDAAKKNGDITGMTDARDLLFSFREVLWRYDSTSSTFRSHEWTSFMNHVSGTAI